MSWSLGSDPNYRNIINLAGGYDVVYEFSESAIESFIRISLGPPNLRRLPYPLAGISEETLKNLEERVWNSYNTLELLRPIFQQQLETWQWPSCCKPSCRERCFDVRISGPTFVLLPERGNSAELCYDVLIILKEALECCEEESNLRPVAPFSHGFDQPNDQKCKCEDGLSLVSLHGCLKLLGTIDKQEDRSNYKFRLVLSVGDSTLTLDTGDHLMRKIYQSAQSYFESAFDSIRNSPPIPITEWAYYGG
jgi:hypothetical protein